MPRHAFLRYLWASPNTFVGLLLSMTAVLRHGRLRVVDGVLEAHGVVLAAMLRRVPIRGGALAITFGHVVLARDARALEATRTHERVHVRQYETWGPAFIPAYLLAGLWALLTGAGGYTGNGFERQARRAESCRRETACGACQGDGGTRQGSAG